MYRVLNLGLRASALVACMVFLLASCKNEVSPPSKSSDFVGYVSAYTSGLVSKEADIRIVLAKPVENYPGAGEPADLALISIEPKIEGLLKWSDQNSLVFTPNEKLPEGQDFQFKVHLSKIYADVPAELKSFAFNIKVISQSFSPPDLVLRSYSNTDLRFNKIEGEVISGDVADISELAPLLKASQKGKSLNVTWTQGLDRMHHYFVIDSVNRGENASSVNLTWGDKLANTGQQELFEIPSLSDFKVLSISVIQSPEQQLIINFSDPLQEEQNINGLVSIENYSDPRFVIDNTQLKLFIKGTISGDRKISVYPGIKNASGYAFKELYETVAKFADVKPAVQLIGKGTILPNSGNLVLPFKAVNLSAVDVYILKIFANNVPQYLQTNQLEGNYQLTRVGRPVAYKKVVLTGGANDLKRWNNFSLDLAEIIKPEPGAIYRVEMKIKKSYSLYACGENSEEEELTELEDEGLNTAAYDNPSNYYWDDYYYEDYYWEDYDYSQRDNPCNVAYFSSQRNVATNILATNLAVTVKGGDNNVFHAFVTDVLTAKPVSGALVQILNYQQQEIATGGTSSDGSIKFELDSKPFLAVATKDKQTAYLRIDDGSALSLSNFDIAGGKVTKGLKGFIYAERGVWRPGDTIHTMFMIEDGLKTLPANHPVIFEVRNPDGKIVERQVNTTHVSGIYKFHFATSPEAKTGFYNCNVRVGSVSFHKSLRVETIKPNRLKVKLSFDEDVLSNSEETAHLHSNWLTGAVARNLNADINLQMRMQYQPFKGFEDFDFIDDTRSFHTSETMVFEGKLDASGDANPSLILGSYSQAPGMLQASFITRIFENGGDFSIDRQTFNYAPFKHFVGVKSPRPTNTPWLQTDNPISVEVASVDVNGKGQNRKLQAQVYSLDWSWWWGSGRNGLGNYLNSGYSRLIGTYNVNTVDAKGKFNFQVAYPNYGNYLIRVCDEESGHCTSQVVYVDWPSSRDRSGRSNPGAPTMLSFSSDKESYNTGDVATLTIPTAEAGRLLVSIETGSKLIMHQWVDAKAGQTEVAIEITKEMTPNVYAFVSYIQPHSKSINDLPIRLYGVIPIKVNDASTKLTPVIKTATEWVPEKGAQISITEANNKPMTYTIAIVDEGLLDITRFKTPDPWSHFYQREALGIRTWDFFDNIMGAFGGVIEKNFAIGGDQELDPSGKKRLNRFTPVVKVLGPFKLAAGKTANHKFTMPNYIGSVRVMVVARHEETYGSAEKAVPVRKPLMVLATLPRVLGPGEKLRLPVQVFAMKKEIKNVEVKLKTNGLFKTSNTEQKISFSEVGDQMVYFDLEVKDKTGKGVVDVTVTSGSEKATYQIALEVRNPNSIEIRNHSAALQAGESKTFELEKYGSEGTNKVSIQASRIPELNIADALAYLLRYPHGCIEQTISTALPQLYVGKLTQLTPEQKTLIKENVMYALNKLQANQHSSGAFSTWPSSSRINYWTTSYAGHFMLEAEKQGYVLPGNMKSRWLSYQKNAAANWSDRNHEYWRYMEHSYNLYVLALAGEADLGAMNRLRNRVKTKHSAWRLAAAYILVGQPEVAKELMAKEFPAHNNFYYDPTFGNEMRASAMRLENYLLLKDETHAFEQAVILAKQMNNHDLYSTQGTAFGLMMMSKFLDQKKNAVLKFNWKAGKNSQVVEQSKALYLYELPDFEKQVTVTNTSDEVIFVSLSQQGQPVPGKEQIVRNGINTSVVFKTLDGGVIEPHSLPQGEDFKAIVTISSTADKYKLYDMALSQIFPSGWEIVNTRFMEMEDISSSSYASYQDFRDDRVYTYFGIYDSKSRTYEVRLNASYVGKYYMPGVKVEAMYYPEVIYIGTGSWIEVIPRD